MIVQIPLREDLPSYEFRTDLDGVSYVLRVKFNERTERWSLDVMDAGGTPLRTGEMLVPDYPLFRGDAGFVPGFPPGKFLLIDTSGASRPPGKISETLGDDPPIYSPGPGILGKDLILLYESAS